MITEDEIKTAGAAVAPRVTPADIEANIASEHYFTAEEGAFASIKPPKGSDIVPPALSLLTFCVLVLRNGFTVTGESACASPENFNAEIGRKVARDNAVAKVWPLMGYELKSRLSAAQAKRDALPPTPAGAHAYCGTKDVFAKPMTRAEYNVYRGWELPADEDGADKGYLVEYVDGGKSNHPAHAGYISWSPAEVFARAYSLI